MEVTQLSHSIVPETPRYPNPIRLEPHARIYNTLCTIFPYVRPFGYMSHSFHEIYSFTLASKTIDPDKVDIEPTLKETNLSLKYYSAELHQGLFKLPACIYESYRTYDRLITDDDVVYYPDKE